MAFTRKCLQYVKEGDIDQLEKLTLKYPVSQWRVKIDSEAAWRSQLKVVIWLRDSGYRMNWRRVAVEACQADCLEIVQLSYREVEHTNREDLECYLLISAVNNKRYAILEWSQTLSPPIRLIRVLINVAIENQDCKILEWLLKNGCPIPNDFHRYLKRSKEPLSEILHFYKAPGKWECREGRQEECRYCQIEKIPKVWEEWSEYQGEGEYSTYIQWPPEEVMEEIVKMMTQESLREK